MAGSAVQQRGLVDRELDYRYDHCGYNRTAVTGAAAPGPWVQPTLDGINQLLQLASNWDSYRARPLDPRAALAAFELLLNIMRPGAPMPSVVPTPRGTVQIEWHINGVDLEIDVRSATSALASFEDLRSGETWEKEILYDLRPLTAAMRRLVTPA